MLSETQKSQIRLYLGYPDMMRYKHTRLESVLDNLSPEAEVLVGECLAKLVTIESSLVQIATTVASGVGIKRVDEIWFDNGANATRGTTEVRKAGRQYVSRISIITGVPIYSDVFGSAGYLGDSFSGFGGRSGGGGGWYGLG